MFDTTTTTTTHQRRKRQRRITTLGSLLFFGCCFLLCFNASVDALVVGTALTQQQQQSLSTALDEPGSLIDDYSMTLQETPHARSVQKSILSAYNKISTIRSVDWCGGMLPLQIHHGKSLERQRRNERPTSELNNNKSLAQWRARQLLSVNQHLHMLYCDSHICVTHKPSGVLCVPGVRRNPCLAELVYQYMKPDNIHMDKMIVHRLDMDTSGVVVFALNKEALQILHSDFRDRRVYKSYEALLCGHVSTVEGEIQLALERDPDKPPFMRVAMMRNQQSSSPHANNNKFLNQAPKPSETHFRVLSYEYLDNDKLCPVTRVELIPHTGRTHQLRVHCAALGHAIVGDDIYGLHGEGSPRGGVLLESSLEGASREVQERIRQKNRMLCLHARQLNLRHPVTGAPMIFRADPNF